MHYLYYDVQFFTTEYPEYVHTQYNDQFTIAVNSPSKGISSYGIDVNSGDFVLSARDAPLLGTGFNVFAADGDPGTPSNGIDWLTTTPNPTGADAGATALVGRQHPVSPGEQITVTFDIVDAGDNQLDSTAFLDNLRFSGFAKTEMIARKTVQDLNGGFVEPEDILEYTITVSNIGTAAQNNNPGHEFEDLIPINTDYVPSSATASSGTISYDLQNNKIVWDGSIPAQSSVALSFRVTVDLGVMNGVKISNQGIVHWDSNEDGTNDKNELTDDPGVDDGIDQDGDGFTYDDDPMIVTVSSWEPPPYLEETFADDTTGEKATQSYQGQLWFDTSTESVKSNFEVAGIYQYSTSKSFKTKLRACDSPQYWNYSLRVFNRNITYWEVRFACANLSEAADLIMIFKNTGGREIARLKFDYVEVGGALPSSNHSIKLYYLSPGTSSWVQISTIYLGGYLYNGWYRLRLEKNGINTITYKLYHDIAHIEYLMCNHTESGLSVPFSNLAQIVWSSTKNPVVCPIIFWDEHRIGLSSS